MSLKWAVVCTLAVSASVHAKTNNDIDTHSVEWLLSQINIGEVQENKDLIADSLQKLLAIAPNRIESQCALARFEFANGKAIQANQILRKIDGNNTRTHPCVEQLRLIARLENEDKADIQQAKLLARAGRYEQARLIYSRLFKNTYPSLAFELEHLSWYAQEQSQWQNVKKGYERLLRSYENIGAVDIAYARHLLRNNPTDSTALTILSKYGATSRYSNEVEAIWLGALSNMQLNSATEKQFQRYFSVYPFSSKGELQYQDFKKDLKARQKLLANPAYQLWLKGEALLEKNKLVAAEPLLLKALKGRPNDGAIMRSLGTLYLRMGKNQTSYNYFTKAYSHTADFAERETLKDLATTAKFWLYIRQAKEAINNSQFKTALLKLNLADTLEQDPASVLYNRGLLQFAQGNYSQAAAIYQTVLKNDPLNNGALTGLLEIVELDNNEQSLIKFYNALSQSQKAQLKPVYAATLSSQLREKARQYSDAGDTELAEQTLKEAIELAPEQPWLYYDLAFIYQQNGLTKKAKTLFNNVLWQFPLNPQLRYSHALFLRSIDDYQGALNTLEYVPVNDRNDDIISLEQQLRLNESLRQSERHLNTKNRTTAIFHLSNLEAQNLTPVMKAELSRSWYQIDEKKHALKLINNALNTEPTLSPYWHMLYAQWLLEQNERPAVEQWFSHYSLPNNASAGEVEQYVNLYTTYINQYYEGGELLAKLNQLDQKYQSTPAITTALINANLALGQQESAIIVYQQKLKNNQPIEPQAMLAIAKAYRELGNDFQAKEVTERAITQTDDQQAYLQRQIMASLNDFNYAGDALVLANQLIAKSPNDKELSYFGAEVARNFNEQDQAKQWYLKTLSSEQRLNDESFYKQIANIDENDAWYINGAKRELINEQSKNQAYIAIGVNFSGQTSTESEATLGAGLVPIEAYFPLWQGQGFIKIDPTTISAQTTRFDEQFAGSRYGQGALCIFTCAIEEVSPEQDGVDIGIGWQNENWRVDVGTTPLGFLIEDIVWGVNYANSIGDFGYSLELEKRPVTSSVLSYAGLEDVNTGEIWGGVRSTGLTANLSHDLGGDWGFWSSADFTLYKGQNVKDNQRYRVMGGSYYRVISNQEREFTVGASLLHWAYQYNLSEETWGHSGYYSPQNYVGLSVPLSYDARWGDDFVYRLKTGISYSQTKTQAIDFYPNDTDLQLQAYDRESITGVDPVFESDDSSGVSYNLEGSFEYRITPHWFFGGYLAIDRADFYEPNFGQLYIRYYFNPVYGTLEFPGTPIIPYADF